MHILGSFWTVIIVGVLSLPVLAIVSLIQSSLLKKRVNDIQNELDLLRLAPETKTSESVHARLRRLEERLDQLARGPAEPEIQTIDKPIEISFEPPKTVAEPIEIPVPSDPFLGSVSENPVPAETKKQPIDWEKFTAGKLMSWIGGFALFLGAIFFAKYSFDHGLISPALRVAMGLVIGAAAVIAGLKFQTRYAVTGQTLAAAGAAILYAVSFAAHSLYGFLGPTETFLFLSLVTVLAFLLSARMNSQYIAILALVGGFLVPPLISTGADRPFGLFAYVTLLNMGLLALVAVRGWGFLWGFAGAGTALLMAGWWSKFYGPEKTMTATAIFLWFPLFFAAACAWMEKRNEKEEFWTVHGAGLISLVSIVLGSFSLFHHGVPQTPLPAFLVLLGADLVTAWLAGIPRLARGHHRQCAEQNFPGLVDGNDRSNEIFRLVVRHGKNQIYHLIAGGIIFFVLLGWTQERLTSETLPVALGAYLAFGGLHGALSFVLYRRGAPKEAVILGHLFPVALLIPMTLGLLKNFAAPVLVWPVIFGLNAIALLAALATGFIWAALGALAMTFVAAWLWIPRLAAGDMAGLLVVVGAMAAVFFGAGYYFMNRPESKTSESKSDTDGGSWAWPEPWKLVLPALSGILPFFLLALAALRLRPDNPTSLFALAVLLAVLLLGLLKAAGKQAEALGLVALAGAALVQYAWLGAAFSPETANVSLPWFAGFSLAFLLLPFLFPTRFGSFRLVWIASALSGPLHFLLFYRSALTLGYAPHIGLLPVMWSLISLGALAQAARVIPDDDHRQGLVALFGAVSLFFITLIFPLQFEKQWITLGWALEGVALLWLHRRIPHPGLKIWALGLLTVAFARLAMNPAVFSYHPREPMKIFNWYFYAYGLVAMCQYIAARLWPLKDPSAKPSDWDFLCTSARTITVSFGTILLFLLLNIEIADYFSADAVITFNLKGSLAQDLAYTLGWGVFGFGLLLVGLAKTNVSGRWAGLALLGVTVGKLFLHDVWRLPLLYRSAAFAGLALLLIAGSFFFQRFQNKSPEAKP
jgi:hypothetical protein